MSNIYKEETMGSRIILKPILIGASVSYLFSHPFIIIVGHLMMEAAGTGLGLPLTKSLVEMHGGRNWVESEGEGKGSRFSFVLPL